MNILGSGKVSLEVSRVYVISVYKTGTVLIADGNRVYGQSLNCDNSQLWEFVEDSSRLFLVNKKTGKCFGIDSVYNLACFDTPEDVRECLTFKTSGRGYSLRREKFASATQISGYRNPLDNSLGVHSYNDPQPLKSEETLFFCRVCNVLGETPMDDVRIVLGITSCPQSALEQQKLAAQNISYAFLHAISVQKFLEKPFIYRKTRQEWKGTVIVRLYDWYKDQNRRPRTQFRSDFFESHNRDAELDHLKAQWQPRLWKCNKAKLAPSASSVRDPTRLYFFFFVLCSISLASIFSFSCSK